MASPATLLKICTHTVGEGISLPSLHDCLTVLCLASLYMARDFSPLPLLGWITHCCGELFYAPSVIQQHPWLQGETIAKCLQTLSNAHQSQHQYIWYFKAF